MKLPTFFARKRNLYWTIAIVVIIVLIVITTEGGDSDSTHPLTIRRERFVNTVSITGKAVFDDRANLGFDKSGRISAIYKKVGDKVSRGDLIASIDNGDINAELASKQATVDRERAKLDSTVQGTRPEQMKIYEQSYNDAASSLIVAMRAAYLSTEAALINDVNTVFNNGSSINPEITILNLGDSQKRPIENQRATLNSNIERWKTTVNSLSSNSDQKGIDSARAITSSSFIELKSFMDQLGAIAKDLNPDNSGYSDEQIDEIRDTINSAAQTMATASNAFVTAETAYNNAKDTLALAKSGSTSFDINAQTASLRAAEADLANTRARFSQTIISSPFEGIVTRIDAKLGEIVSPTESPVTVMNLDSLIIEAYVPEININQIEANDNATITFDAFSGESYSGRVTSIDLAETDRDGVAAYKIQVELDSPSQYIRSGMTSDVVITTNEKDNIIAIPKGYLIKEGESSYVLKGKNGNAEKTLVTTADIGSLSRIEIVDGLSDGDSIISPVSVTP